MTNLEALVISHRIQLRLLRLMGLKEKDMAVSAAVAALITEFDQATYKIAARIQTLIDKAESGA